MESKVNGILNVPLPAGLSPLILKDDSNLYRTPTVYAEEQCTLYVGDNMKRIFTSKTMPREVKVKLGMVRGYEGYAKLWDNAQIRILPLVVYENTYPKEFLEIGWRVTENLYCLSLTLALLRKLQAMNDERE